MIKKLILLLLVVCGGVSANATDYVLAGVSDIANGEQWNNNASQNVLTMADANHYYLVVNNCNLNKDTKYSWQIVEKGTWNIKARWDEYYVSESGKYTMIFIFNSSENTTTAIPVQNLTLSNNYGSNNTWNQDNSSFYFQYKEKTKWSIDIDASLVSSAWRFRVWTSGVKAGDGWHNIAANSEGQVLNIGESSNANYAPNDTNNSWEIAFPSYSFNKYTISIEYDVINYQWIVSADAFISPNLTKEYGTFSVAAPINLSKATGLTAYYASNVSGSTVTMTKLEEAVTANTGLLLKKGEGEISIPVAASGTDLSNLNSLKYGTGATFASDGNTNRYVLATQGGVQNFYKLSTSGSTVPVGKAYLEIPATTGTAPSLSIDIDGETTGIEVINAEIPELGTANEQTFDLSGRRIAEPTKGVYIMNGKKMIVK